MLNAIDLFAGCGGFSCGFEKAGFRVKKAVEFDKSIATSYKHNHKKTIVFAEDISRVDNASVFSRGEADVIIGGPPCQGFSMAGARIRGGFIDDPRNYLFKHYYNVVRIVMPKLFVLENVKGILTLHNGKVFQEIKNIFEDPRNYDDGQKPYKIQYTVVNAKDFGIPQNRERVVVVGSQIDFDLAHEIENTKISIADTDESFFKNVTVWEAISNMPEPTVDGIVGNLTAESEYQRFLMGDTEETFNHIQTKHNRKAIDRMKRVGINENSSVLGETINSKHSGAYGRLDPDGIAPTITTRFDTPSGGRFIHPYDDRTITPREAARMQSFPDDFEFLGSKTSICKQVGNAVPPKMAFFLGEMIRKVIENEECKKV